MSAIPCQPRDPMRTMAIVRLRHSHISFEEPRGSQQEILVRFTLNSRHRANQRSGQPSANTSFTRYTSCHLHLAPAAGTPRALVTSGLLMLLRHLLHYIHSIGLRFPLEASPSMREHSSSRRARRMRPTLQTTRRSRLLIPPIGVASRASGFAHRLKRAALSQRIAIMSRKPPSGAFAFLDKRAVPSCRRQLILGQNGHQRVARIERITR